MARRKHPADEPTLPVPELPVDPLVARMRKLSAECRARNLANAVLLAEQAASGYGPLIDHFAELGRRYARPLLKPTPKEIRKAFQVIEGGRA